MKMGLIKDFLNRNKKEALSDATISIQNKKINEQWIYYNINKKK